MNQTQRKFVRCFNCNMKPATIKCFDCNPNEPAKLCYHCDAEIHPDQDHQKQIIPYDQMLDIVSLERDRSATPNKENYQPRSKSPKPMEQYDSQAQHLSSILRSRIQRNTIEENDDYTSVQKSSLKSVELKFRIKFQEQENTINLLKQHIETIENKHKENISKMREQIIKAQDEAYQKTEETHGEIHRIKKMYDDKLSGYSAQLESESQFNNQLQTKLEDLRTTHQIKLSEAQQQISQLRAEIERRKFQEEKIQIDAESQMIANRKECQIETEKQIVQIKQDCMHQIDEYKQKISHKQDLISDLQGQIQQLQSTLRDVEQVWQKKLYFEQQQLEDLKQKYYSSREECEQQIKVVKNLQSEMIIYQKENELFQKEKVQLTRQLAQLNEKNDKMDKFIYGSKKSRPKY